MPAVEKWEYPGGVVALWEMKETVSQLELLCIEEEVSAAGKMTEKRAREFLSWRALLHSAEPGTVAGYDNAGGPVVVRGKYPYIGVSHTEGYAAVILGYRPCAVDIESFGRDLSRAACRFTDTSETDILNVLPAGERLTAVWCVKEALFKLHRESGVDFKADMQILSASDSSHPLIRARFRDQENHLYLRRHENLCLVFVWK